jgi:hypothetical protein
VAPPTCSSPGLLTETLFLPPRRHGLRLAPREGRAGLGGAGLGSAGGTPGFDPLGPAGAIGAATLAADPPVSPFLALDWWTITPDRASRFRGFRSGFWYNSRGPGRDGPLVVAGPAGDGALDRGHDQRGGGFLGGQQHPGSGAGALGTLDPHRGPPLL